MAKLSLVTSETPAGLLDTLAEKVAADGPGAGWCFVVARSHLEREVTDALLRATGESAWMGTRTISLDSLVEHYAHQTDKASGLTPLQVRQVLQAAVLRLHDESNGRLFHGRVSNGRVSEQALRSLAAVFSELEGFYLSPAEIQERLEGGAEDGSTLSQRAQELLALYRVYWERMLEYGCVGPQGAAVRAADAASHLAPPPGVYRFIFLGLDGSSEANVGLRLFRALGENDLVDAAELAVVLPDDPFATAWKSHGNLPFFQRWTEDGGRRVTITPHQHLAALPADLSEIVRNPFDFQTGAVPSTGAVRAIRVPDVQTEVEWVAADVKRVILDEGVNPADIVVVDRDMGERTGEISAALDDLGVPCVGSMEYRLRDVPSVRSLLAVFRLVSRGWRAGDVIALASSPYLDLDLDPGLLSSLGAQGETPRSAADWLRRIAALKDEVSRGKSRSGCSAEEVGTLEDSFRRFVERVDELAGREGTQPPSAWVDALLRAVAEWNVEARINTAAEHVGLARQADMITNDLDGVNALLRGALDWLRGREVAGLPDDDMDAAAFQAELEAIAVELKIRASTYPREAVHLATPAQVGLRSFRHVYVTGLADGVFPRASATDEQVLNEEERRTLRLAGAEERAARERLNFHLAVAAASERVTLVTPAADARGKALVASPFLTALKLRVDNLDVKQVAARDMLPGSEQDALSERDIEILGARRFRDGADADDAVVATWMGQEGAPQALEGWGAETTRRDLSLPSRCAKGEAPDFAEFAGVVKPESVPARIRDVAATFSASDFWAYDQCPFRTFTEKVLGVRESEDDKGESAAYGTLHHIILERLYKGMQNDGIMPPRTQADVERAIPVLERVARQVMQESRAGLRQELWREDLDHVLGALRQFVRRDLGRMVEMWNDPAYPALRTEIFAFEEWLGGDEKPVTVDEGGVRFRLHGKLDRLERVCDDRLEDGAAAANGYFVVRDYKSGRGAGARLQDLLDGKSLQQGLYAEMVAQSYTGGVFSLGELRTSNDEDPAPIDVRGVEVADDGVRLTGEGNAVADIRAKARERAAEMVSQMRAGMFSPHGGQGCRNCPFPDICRTGSAGGWSGPGRAKAPLRVSKAQAERAREEFGGA